MHFFDFINTTPQQTDKSIQEVIKWIKADKDFPKDTSDPARLAIYLYLKLNPDQTSAYQKLLMMYQHTVKNHKLPERTTARQDMFMDALNLIVGLQNNDNRYRH